MRIVNLIIVLLCVFYSTNAEARRGIGVAGWYEDVDAISELPATAQFQDRGKQLYFGHKYKVYHAMFLPLAVTSNSEDFVLYNGKGSATLLYDVTNKDYDVINSQLGYDPRTQYKFNWYSQIWGWLIVIPGSFLVFAYRWLKEGTSTKWEPSLDQWQFSEPNQYHSPPDNLITDNLIKEKPIKLRSPSLSNGFGRRGL
jgi:hypothetical protein